MEKNPNIIKYQEIILHIHILGICGTFMGGIALLARAAGHQVSGSDANVYPPMSTQLESQGITLMEGYDAGHLNPEPDCVVVGNVMSRGNPVIEYMLDRDIPYTSGPQWLYEHILKERWVLAVAGTHGKTTTSSMLAWILEYAGLEPGYLIGGVPENFGVSARFGKEPFFVVEADEYDTAFFDKRSKFVHYHPRTLVLNNLEFDHADIFPDLESIKRQFHHLLRMVPGNGLVISNTGSSALQDVIGMGCWTPVESFSPAGKKEIGDWSVQLLEDDGSSFKVQCGDETKGTVNWSLIGLHNVDNAVAAIAAARHAGVPVEQSMKALQSFKAVKRRLELKADINGVRIFDDFAHHPTAISSTLEGLRKHVGEARIIVLLEPRSNTMRMGVHKDTLADSLELADRVLMYRPEDLEWNLDTVSEQIGDKAAVFDSIDLMLERVKEIIQPGDQLLIMSNGAFGGIHERLIKLLRN
jgi:UDP-N-acetylmuramate: L-alanyl-gamma-D-glutamyl-meso-diaminopimelate ligase